ncbi:hypothetical protein OQA88_6038 [Cercophora sp. LCS_1]
MFSPAALVTLALASVALADDNAVSVSTLDFKNRFQQSAIVPEIIAALDPSVSFYVSYRAGTDGHSELLVPGASLTVTEAAQAPLEFSVENLNNATNITAATRYLIYLLDADAPSRNNPNARTLRHYLAGNYTVANVMSSVLPTAQRLTVAPQNFAPHTQFTPPAPLANTGVHRFIYALYTQPPRFNTASFASVGMELETANWNLSRWRGQLGLGPAIGATFFTIDTNSNGGQGFSSNGSAIAGAGMTAPTSMYGVGMAAVMAVFGVTMMF